MAIIRPRLVDYFNIPITLYLDPFLLWKSPSQQDNALHLFLINSFNHLGYMCSKGKTAEAIDTLVNISECSEVGLGTGKTKRGLKISQKTASEILALFNTIPTISTSGFSHFEEIQLYVNNISKDRISDIACNFLKSFMIDFTQDECKKYNIPMRMFSGIAVYSNRTHCLEKEEIYLPFNPEDGYPIILVPKRWLRYTPWINYEEYFDKGYVKVEEEDNLPKVKVLDYNRKNYGIGM